MVRRLVGAMLGAIAGAAFTTMGLIETRAGFELDLSAGNDSTETIILVGVVLGVLLGATLLSRWPALIAGIIIGLAAGILLRDNASMFTVQPPWVFLLLFGLPLVGGAGGYLLHRALEAKDHSAK